MKRILIIEDEISIREELSILLNHAGYKVICAEDFSNVIEIFDSARPEFACMLYLIPSLGFYVTVCQKIISLVFVKRKLF